MADEHPSKARVRTVDQHVMMNEEEIAELDELVGYWRRTKSDVVRHAVHEAVMRERHARRSA